MAVVQPFRGLRPRRDIVKSVASPPYDIIDTDGARRRAKDNPVSYLHIIKPEIDLEPSIKPSDPRVYAKGVETLRQFIKQKVLIQEKTSCFYVYKQILGSHKQTGLVACVSVDEYLSGKIKTHEHTQQTQVQDRLKLMQALNAQTGPAFLVYKNNRDLQSLITANTPTQPLYNFYDDNNVFHKFHKIDELLKIQEIQHRFENIDSFYIADGHHRSEAAAKNHLLRQDKIDHKKNQASRYFLAVIFPDSELFILPYNRVVKDLNNLTTESFLAQIQTSFEIKKATERFSGPMSSNQFGMYFDKSWYILSLQASANVVDDPVKELDVSLLQDYLLEPVLGINDPKSDERIEFIGGINSIQLIEQLVDSGEFRVGFSLRATTMTQVMRVADAGKMMPPKSTWFEPKLLSGLVTYPLDDLTL